MKEKGVHALLVDCAGSVALARKSTSYVYDNRNTGKVSMFGGKQEDRETSQEAVVRELSEELGITVKLPQKPLCVLYKEKDIDGVDVEVTVYVVRISSFEGLKLQSEIGNEGPRDENIEIILGDPEELFCRPDVSRMTRLALEAYISNDTTTDDSLIIRA
jgi:8-oxo-dGTP pyrophosphatase MutT (NUDIX family)